MSRQKKINEKKNQFVGPNLFLAHADVLVFEYYDIMSKCMFGEKLISDNLSNDITRFLISI